MSKRSKGPAPKVGDIVLLDFTEQYATKSHGAFEARILQLNVNMSGQTIVNYERVDGVHVKFPHCNLSFVARVVTPAPYIISPKMQINVFARERRFVINKKHGGLRIGGLATLTMEALARVHHVDLPYFLHEDRMQDLYEKACFPGQVAIPDIYKDRPWYSLAVRWKTFQHWVNQNTLKLIATKAEYVASCREFNRNMSEDTADAWRASEEYAEEQDRIDDSLYAQENSELQDDYVQGGRY